MELDAWHDFFVITGGSAAALVGLLFVVISVAPEVVTRSRGDVRAFVSPTVGFFSAVLVLAAVMTMPLPTLWRGIVVACVGAAGTGQLLIAHVPQRARAHEARLGIEDLLLYFVLPLVTYLGVFAGGVAIAVGRDFALTILGGAIIALLAIGLRNAWDLVNYTSRKHVQPDEPAA